MRSGPVTARTRKIARNLCGGALILVGIAGLALPFLQGIALIVAGFILLDFEKKQALIDGARDHPAGRWLERKWRRMRPGAGARGGGRP